MPRYEGTGYMVTLDPVLAEYLDTACWASVDDDGIELYANDLSDCAIAKMTEDLSDFLCDNADDIGEHIKRAAQCFWLNRNGHGFGFWDDPTWDRKIGKRLSDASKAYGTADLYRGDDGLIYHS